MTALDDVSLDLPRDRLIVFTGLSGSGKSSLAFDTIYAEGQRRYVESLSAYARQFLEQVEMARAEFGAAQRDACMGDYEKLCKGTVPGGGRIIACLAKQSDKLTPACKKVLAEAEKK